MNIRKTVLALTAASILLAPTAALAQFTAAPNFGGTEDTSTSLIGAITNIVNSLLALAGLIAAIFVVIGGVRYITSQGDEDATAAAKNTILYAAIGIIVILLSAVIVNFVITSIN